MFLAALLIGIAIGLLLKGNIKNIDVEKVKSPYLAIVAFSIEFILFTLVRKGIISRGNITYVLYLTQYILILIFIYKNRKDYAFLVIGIGIILNALAIFLNGGAMPVSPDAMVKAGIVSSVNEIKETMASSEGLYIIKNSNTIFPFLGDVIPLKHFRNYVISIGDIFISLGLIWYIVKR
ncbi:DUF5317 domain-containing protein [Caloramator sp. mosi_1]|uniref:DUF5317 domain-containing protein n=1 Tax=Caloramator sp. mosi_1 TaxID=3023090 RepID=UPI002361C482|nr:DUF5317 domain-containing protein [Caloramator sp. mosi_1]WDC85404.1 DUF5317 domain-containing protein [Caloramator sp. mosi_1]